MAESQNRLGRAVQSRQLTDRATAAGMPTEDPAVQAVPLRIGCRTGEAWDSPEAGLKHQPAGSPADLPGLALVHLAVLVASPPLAIRIGELRERRDVGFGGRSDRLPDHVC